MGTLYLVSTPIGNLEDITLRALRVLKEATLIASEDTRQTRKLLSRYGVRTRQVSYHEHSPASRLASLLRTSVTVLFLTPRGQTLEQARATQEIIRTFFLWKAAQPQPVITRYIGGTSNDWRIDRLESRIRSICLEVDCY